MNKTVAIVIAIVVVAAVGIPLAMKYAEPSATQPSKGGPAPAAAAPQPVSNEPPYWNSGNLGGTTWTGTLPPGLKVTIAFQVGGALKVTSDSPILKAIAPSGELSGKWSIEGNRFNMQIDVPGKGPQKLSGTISGKQLIDDKGKPLPLQPTS